MSRFGDRALIVLASLVAAGAVVLYGVAISGGAP